MTFSKSSLFQSSMCTIGSVPPAKMMLKMASWMPLSWFSNKARGCFPRIKYTSPNHAVHVESIHDDTMIVFDDDISIANTKHDDMSATANRLDGVVESGVVTDHFKVPHPHQVHLSILRFV